MPQCNECGKVFPNRIRIDGKEHIVSSRKYCLDCSPFGKHNTRRPTKEGEESARRCSVCGREITGTRRHKCSGCYAKRRREQIRDKVYKIYPPFCTVCGYGGADKILMLDFHHLDQETKMFDVNIANLTTRSWEVVLGELAKCVLLCCRCHREVHAGIIQL